MAGNCGFCGRKVGTSDRFGVYIAENLVTVQDKTLRLCPGCKNSLMKLEQAVLEGTGYKIEREKDEFCSKNSKYPDIKTIAELVIADATKKRKENEDQKKTELELKMMSDDVFRKKYQQMTANRQKATDAVFLYLEKKFQELVYSVDGARGRHIDVYPDKCLITTEMTVGSIITGNATDGEKTIYYQDCIGLQFKQPGALLGYLQFETASGIGNNLKDNFFNENTFTFEKLTPEIEEMYEYVQWRLDETKKKMLER